jgi:hypothetical protein
MTLEQLGDYELVRDAILQHLPQFIFEDDIAEEAILVDAIQRIGHLLRNVRVDEETGRYIGTIDLNDVNP